MVKSHRPVKPSAGVDKSILAQSAPDGDPTLPCAALHGTILGPSSYTAPRPDGHATAGRPVSRKDDMPSQSPEMNDVLESVWNQFSHQLRAFIRVRVRDEETAEDILQKVLLRIHAKIGTLRDMTKLES